MPYGTRDTGSTPPPPDVSEVQQENRFFNLVERVDPGTRETRRFREILKEAEDTGDYEAALKSLEDFLERRETSLDQVKISWENPELHIDREGLEQMVREIKYAVRNPDAFLGNGSVAEVYTLRRPGSNLCIKWITDYARYAEGVLTSKELEFLDVLRNLKVEGVRTPKPFFAFSTLRMDGIVMEQLNATNFRRVIEKQTTEGIPDELPPGFDVQRYFGALERYVKEMHKLGIYHGDLHLRNMMIDRQTGLPYLIDFGKSKFDWELDKSKANPTDYAANDLETLRLAKIEALRWIEKQAGKAA